MFHHRAGLAHALAPIGRHLNSQQIPDSPAGFLESWRPYFSLGAALKAFSIAFVAS